MDEIRVSLDPALEGAVLIGTVHAWGCRAGESSANLDAALDAAIARAQAATDEDEAARQAVRKLLRHGSYRPTGRGKPASEYLLGAAREGSFPRLGNLVDVNNLVSLESGLPASILDVGRAAARDFVVRRGRAGESYVFNAAGQRIELADLLLVATLPGDQPCANPVKDALATKVAADTTEVLAVIYAPPALRDRLERVVARFDALLRSEAAAAGARTALL